MKKARKGDKISQHRQQQGMQQLLFCISINKSLKCSECCTCGVDKLNFYLKRRSILLIVQIIRSRVSFCLKSSFNRMFKKSLIYVAGFNVMPTFSLSQFSLAKNTKQLMGTSRLFLKEMFNTIYFLRMKLLKALSIWCFTMTIARHSIFLSPCLTMAWFGPRSNAGYVNLSKVFPYWVFPKTWIMNTSGSSCFFFSCELWFYLFIYSFKGLSCLQISVKCFDCWKHCLIIVELEEVAFDPFFKHGKMYLMSKFFPSVAVASSPASPSFHQQFML